MPGAARAEDHRVSAVLEVLNGSSLADVARRWSLDPALIHRWRTAFVDAGRAAVTNRPDADTAAQRDRYLSIFAHELRTPLAVARGWASALADGDVGPGESAVAMTRLEDALVRLGDRVRDVELLAHASMGRLRLTPVPTTVAELCEDLPGAGPTAYADTVVDVDRELFRRVLRDVWQASGTDPRPAKRYLEVETVAPWLELRVVRVGDPIDPIVLRALFEPFELNNDGTGVTIGLYLARALVVAHGGTLGVDQGDERATFWVRVPAESATAPAR